MNFSDKTQRLLIGRVGEELLSFKAYLEKSDVQVKFIDETLKYTPLGYTNNTMITKVSYIVDFSFNVLAENEEEVVQNYIYLHKLFNMIKPTYNVKNGQYIADPKNIFGNVRLAFSGLPKLTKSANSVDLYVTNFGYQINKDMGFIDAHYPYDYLGEELKEETEGTTTQGSDDRRRIDYDPTGFTSVRRLNYRLLPIGYKLDISGRVQLSLSDSIWKETKVPQERLESVQNESKYTALNENEKDFFERVVKSVVNDEKILDDLTPLEQRIAIQKVKYFQSLGLIDYEGAITLEDEKLTTTEKEIVLNAMSNALSSVNIKKLEEIQDLAFKSVIKKLNNG